MNWGRRNIGKLAFRGLTIVWEEKNVTLNKLQEISELAIELVFKLESLKKKYTYTNFNLLFYIGTLFF